jgi:hypothetical protein
MLLAQGHSQSNDEHESDFMVKGSSDRRNKQGKEGGVEDRCNKRNKATLKFARNKEISTLSL